MKKWSLFIGSPFGIKLYIHWTFSILLIWIFLSFPAEDGLLSRMENILFILCLFVCVLLHELGHSLTAKRFGINTKDITLYPIGGIASLESMPEKPKQEILVALAGPAVNVLIGGVIAAYLLVSGDYPAPALWFQPGELPKTPFLVNLLVANLALAVFNIIPAFPMDGGRVLRAMLALKMTRLKATKTAAAVGQVLAMFFVLFGIFNNTWMVFIGLFIFLGAGAEAAYEVTRSQFSGLKVKDALMTHFSPVSPNFSLQKVVDIVLDGAEEEFLVINDEGELKGLLTKVMLINGLAEHGPASLVAGIMRKEFPKLGPDDDLHKVLETFETQSTPVLPVFEGATLLGMVNRQNVLELMAFRKTGWSSI